MGRADRDPADLPVSSDYERGRVCDVEGIDTQRVVHTVFACDLARLIEEQGKWIFVFLNVLFAFGQAINFLRGNE